MLAAKWMMKMQMELNLLTSVQDQNLTYNLPVEAAASLEKHASFLHGSVV
jgi:hypothetical protein